MALVATSSRLTCLSWFAPFVAAHEDELEGTGLGGPFLFGEGVAGHAGHVLFAAVDGQGVECLVHVVEVGGKVKVFLHPALGRVVVAVAVTVERDAEVRGGFEPGHLVDDVPELDLRGVDEPVHAAGHIEAEDEVDGLAFGGLGGFVFGKCWDERHGDCREAGEHAESEGHGNNSSGECG